MLFERVCHGWQHVNFGDLKKLENLFQCIEDLIFKCATCIYFSIYIQCWSNHPLSSTKFQKANLWPRLFQTMFRMLNFSIIKERISHRWRRSSFRDSVISWLFSFIPHLWKDQSLKFHLESSKPGAVSVKFL